MGDFPGIAGLYAPRIMISSVGANSPCGESSQICGQAGASAVWPAANRAIYIPVLIERTVTITQMAAYNGTVVNGNVDIGICDLSNNRLVSSGATLQAGTSTLQVFNITDTTLSPGVYYWSLMSTSGTATFWRTTVNVLVLNACGAGQEATGGTIPATITPVAAANSYLPVFGATGVTVL